MSAVDAGQEDASSGQQAYAARVRQHRCMQTASWNMVQRVCCQRSFPRDLLFAAQLGKPLCVPSPLPNPPTSTPDFSPVCVIRGGDNVLVMCDVLDAQGVPHESNTRAKVGELGSPARAPAFAGSVLHACHLQPDHHRAHKLAAAAAQHVRPAPAPCAPCSPPVSRCAPAPQLEAIINDAVKAEAPLFGFEQEYTMLSKGEGSARRGGVGSCVTG